MFPSPNHRQPWISPAAPAPITTATRALEPFSLPLFRNNNILLTLALHGPAEHRESRTIRSPPLTPPQATKMCASDPLPHEHTTSNTANLQLHQLSNALPTPRNATHLFLQTRNNIHAPWNHHARWEGDEQSLHNNNIVYTFALLVENLHRRSHTVGEEEVSRNNLIAPLHLQKPKFFREKELPRVILSLHNQSGQSWSNIQIWSKIGQTREVEVQILIFLDVSANLNYKIKNGLLRKLM